MNRAGRLAYAALVGRDVRGVPIEHMGWFVRASLLVVLVPGLLAGGDAGPSFDPSALLIPADAPELQANPQLPGRLRASPHAYYRRIGPRFTRLLCERLAERASVLPIVTLHGDAHLEQYAVTDRGRGLSDFDDSTTGSALIDLARFATGEERIRLVDRANQVRPMTAV